MHFATLSFRLCQLIPCEANKVKRLLFFEFAPFWLSFMRTLWQLSGKHGVGVEGKGGWKLLNHVHRCFAFSSCVTVVESLSFSRLGIFAICEALVPFSQCVVILDEAVCVKAPGWHLPRTLPCTPFLKVQEANHSVCPHPSLLLWKNGTGEPPQPPDPPQIWSCQVLGVGKDATI